MLERLRRVVGDLAALTAELDPSLLDGGAARECFEELACAGRLVDAAKTLVAGRLKETGAFDRGAHRSVAHALAKSAGTSIAAAQAMLDTAARLAELPATAQALRAGKLSAAQAALVSEAAAADPSAEAALLESARLDSLKGTRVLSERVIAGATAGDPDATWARQHRARSVRHWRDRHGAGHVQMHGPLDLTARVMAALEPYERELFDRARAGDEPVRSDALRFDAMLAMADSASGELSLGTGVKTTVMVRVDARPFQTGILEPGDTCELVGVGPIPIDVARRMADDAFLKALLTDGVDVLAVSHLGRTIPAHLRSALDERDLECVIAGCNVTWGLEIDHNLDFALGGPTALSNLNKLCPYHHDYKTRHGLRLVGQGTNKRFVPAAHWTPATAPPGRPAPLAAA